MSLQQHLEKCGYSITTLFKNIDLDLNIIISEDFRELLYEKMYLFTGASNVRPLDLSLWRLIRDCGTTNIRDDIKDEERREEIITTLFEETVGQSYDSCVIDFINSLIDNPERQDILHIKYMKQTKFNASYEREQRDAVVKSILSRCSTVDFITDYIEQYYTEYRAWPVVLVNKNLSREEKEKIIKKHYKQKDLPAYCEFLKNNIEDLADLEIFLDIAVIKNNRVSNKESAFHDIIFRILCGDGRATYYTSSSGLTQKFKDLKTFAEKYRDTYFSKEIFNTLLNRWSRTSRGVDLGEIAKVLYLDDKPIKEKLRVVNKYPKFAELINSNKPKLLKDAIAGNDDEALKLVVDYIFKNGGPGIETILGFRKSWYSGWYECEPYLTNEEFMAMISRYPDCLSKISNGDWLYYDHPYYGSMYRMLYNNIHDFYENFLMKLPIDIIKNHNPLISLPAMGLCFDISSYERNEAKNIFSELIDNLLYCIETPGTSNEPEFRKYLFEKILKPFADEEYCERILEQYTTKINSKDFKNAVSYYISTSIGHHLVYIIIPKYLAMLNHLKDDMDDETYEKIQDNICQLSTDFELFDCV